MAAVYDRSTGAELTAGLQGCRVCDEAIQCAERLADARGEVVRLVDDDGEWLVYPLVDGRRESADPLESADQS